MKKFTMWTGSCYRIPTNAIGNMRIEGPSGMLTIFGDHVDMLGKYEKTGLIPEEITLLTVEEMEVLKKRYKEIEK